MPRLTKQTPKYRHHKSRDLAFVEIDKRRIYLGPHNSQESREAYDEIISRWLANGRSLPASKPNESQPELTVTQLVVAYWEYAVPYYGESGHIYGVKCAIRRLRRMYGKLPAEDVGPQALKLFRDALIAEDCSRRYINDQVAHISRMYRWGVAEELIHPDAYRRLKALPGLRVGRTDAKESPPVESVPDDVVECSLEFLPAVVADMVRIQRLTGARPGEICIMRPCDIDRTDQTWIYRPSKHKTQHRGRQRYICIGPKAQEILLSYLLRSPTAFCFSPRDSERQRRAEQHANRKTPLSYGNRPGTNQTAKPKRQAGDRYDTCAFRRAIQRGVKRANRVRRKQAEITGNEQQLLPHWSPNQLRHTAATELRKQFGLEEAQVVLGHANADVTQIYAERDLQKAVEIMREVG